MKTRDEVITLFRDKYDSLQKVCQQQIEPFNEAAIYQNPDGGWQLNLEQPGTDYKAAITLRPNDEVPHEMHGVIGARWFQEGGAFDVNGIPGWLGYPIADEKEEMEIVSPPVVLYVPESPNPLQFRIPVAVSEFEYGRVCWHCGLTWERVYEENTEGQMFIRGEGPFAVCPGCTVSINEHGKQHIPKDIENAAETILVMHGLHVVGARSWSCDLDQHLHVGVNWVFHAEVEEFDRFSIAIGRDGTDIRATINARSKPSLFGGHKTIEKKFTIPNRFRAI